MRLAGMYEPKGPETGGSTMLSARSLSATFMSAYVTGVLHSFGGSMRPILACLVTAVVILASGTAARADEAEDARIKQRLEWFQDQRFGLFMHWGIYANLGCIESWPMSWAD